MKFKKFVFILISLIFSQNLKSADQNNNSENFINEEITDPDNGRPSEAIDQQGIHEYPLDISSLDGELSSDSSISEFFAELDKLIPPPGIVTLPPNEEKKKIVAENLPDVAPSSISNLAERDVGKDLLDAIKNDNKSIIEKHVRETGDVDFKHKKSGYTLLMLAIYYYKDDILEYLLLNNADPLLCNHEKSYAGLSPISLAIQKGNIQAIKSLMGIGKVDVYGDGPQWYEDFKFYFETYCHKNQDDATYKKNLETYEQMLACIYKCS